VIVILRPQPKNLIQIRSFVYAQDDTVLSNPERLHNFLCVIDFLYFVISSDSVRLLCLMF